MDKVKTYIQSLPLLEQIALSAWLGQLIHEEAEVQAETGSLFLERGDNKDVPEWMWEEAEKSLKEFEDSGEVGLSWQEVKKMGDQRKSA